MSTTLSRETVKRIAELSRLSLSEEEITQSHAQLEKMIASFAQISTFPISEKLKGEMRSALVMEKAQGQSEELSQMRKDEAKNTISTQDFLSQSPEREGVFIRVPAILTQST